MIVVYSSAAVLEMGLARSQGHFGTLVSDSEAFLLGPVSVLDWVDSGSWAPEQSSELGATAPQQTGGNK